MLEARCLRRARAHSSSNVDETCTDCNPPDCPTTLPPSSAPCGVEGLACSYSADGCDEVTFTCRDGKLAGECTSAGSEGCPLALPAEGSSCAGALTCSYAETLAYCKDDIVATCDGVWHHSYPACSCPALAPSDGTACQMGVVCSYGECVYDCSEGAFYQVSASCPVP